MLRTAVYPGAFETARRFTESALTADAVVMPTPQFDDWFAEREKITEYAVKAVPLDCIEGWRTDPETGNLTHRSGRFYTVEGLEVTTGYPATRNWSQPIIVQPEIGILGILVKEFNGVLHCLMQAKMEPGNINLLQLAPTVQATRSNYTRVHQGNAIPYLEYFDSPGTGRVLVHTLQSEQGTWFLHKRNRNMVVEATGDVPLRPGFCWLTLAQLRELMLVENLINMDARSVLSIMPLAAPIDRPSLVNADSFRGALVRSLLSEGVTTDTTNLLSWFTGMKSRGAVESHRIPLNQTKRWQRTRDAISHEENKHFSVIGVEISASDREVTHWSQPLIAPVGPGVIALLTRRIHDVLHVLVHARTEAGTFDVMEIAPSVQCIPQNYDGAEESERPLFLDYVLSAPPSRIHFDVVHSEEGGRFYHACSRYLVIEVDDDFPMDIPDDYAWATVREMTDLVRHGHYFNVEARSLLTCLNTLW